MNEMRSIHINITTLILQQLL